MHIMMLRPLPGRWLTLLTLAWLALAIPRIAQAGISAIVLRSPAGAVDVAVGGGASWQPAADGMALSPEDQVRCRADGAVRVQVDDAEIHLGNDSTLVLGYDSVRLRIGTVWARMRKSGRRFSVITPTVALVVRGTVFRVLVGEGSTTVHLLSGNLEATSGQRRHILTPRTQLVATPSGLVASLIDARTLAGLSAEFMRLSATGSGPGDAPSPRRSGAVPVPELTPAEERRVEQWKGFQEQHPELFEKILEKSPPVRALIEKASASSRKSEATGTPREGADDTAGGTDGRDADTGGGGGGLAARGGFGGGIGGQGRAGSQGGVAGSGGRHILTGPLDEGRGGRRGRGRGRGEGGGGRNPGAR